MTDPDRLAAAPEIIVAISGGENSERRAEAAAELASRRPAAMVVLSGRTGLHPFDGVPEAEQMAEVLRRRAIPEDRFRIEDRSRDTIGNAFHTATRFLAGLSPRPITLVTSPFHLERALFIFRFVLGPSWPVTGHPSDAGPRDHERVEREQRYLEETKRMLAGVEPGDVAGVAERLRARWPDYYGDLELGDIHGPA